MDLKEMACGSVTSIHLAQNINHCRAFVNTFSFHKRRGTIRATNALITRNCTLRNPAVILFYSYHVYPYN
jgi:hypothetical protein